METQRSHDILLQFLPRKRLTTSQTPFRGNVVQPNNIFPLAVLLAIFNH